MQSTASYPSRSDENAPAVPLAVWLVRLILASAFMLAILTALALAGAAAYSLHYDAVIFPGVSAWGIDLSGMSPAAAATALSGRFDYASRPAITFADPGSPTGRTWAATPAQLGLRFDLASTVEAAYGVGRSGNPLADALEMIQAWYAGRQVSPVLIYDDRQVLVFLSRVAQDVFLPTVEATLVANGSTVSTTPGQIGRQLDVLATAAVARPVLLAMRSARIPLTFLETPPRVLDASAQAAAAQAILSAPLTLTITQPLAGDPGPWTIDQPTLGSLLRVRRVTDSANAAHYEVGLDATGLRAYLLPLAPSLKQTANNARYLFNDKTQQLELLAPSHTGRDLDVEASLTAINHAISTGAHTVPLVLNLVPPAAGDDATAAKLGITQLVSQQSTFFVGSAPARVQNIQTASARFHGLLVAPGATFSFDDNLGDVSLDSGFAEALIIYGGRTIKGVGGGVCQVSTTVFRTAYFGGFPIVERNSHAYRVGYYERGTTWKGPGLDATVYAPLVDFKFRNDTPSWLLMEVFVNKAASQITWRFYSTSDGRQVTVSPADVANVVPAPAPLYQENPDLPAGTIKQTDYAAEGADVTVSRTITRNGAQTNANEPPVTTHYQPWRAVFEYGPGTQGIPTPTPTPAQ